MNRSGNRYLKWIISIATYGGLLISSCYAQSGFTSSERVSLPSPTATSFLKVQATPVNFYTGALKVSVPIYSLKSGDFSIPIALNYSTSGIRVSERAGDVGLGWSLQAGGVVTRVMKGRPDEKPNGYLEEVDYINENWGHLPKSYLYKIAEGHIDAQPDLFYFSAPGISGKFVFMEDGKIQTIPKQNTKIQLTANGWIITANNGIRYTFSGKETTTSFSEYSEGVNSSVSNFISSWFLTEIEFPTDSRTITFEYGDELSDKSSEYKVFYNNFLLPGESNCCQLHIDPSEEYLRTSTTTQSLNLSNIYIRDNTIFKKVKFLYGNSDQLQAIEVYRGSQLERRFHLKYGHFNNELPDYRKRLRLDEVQEEGKNGKTKPPYKFFYEETHPFPEYDSFSIDHWGYYNGKDNNTLIPAFYRNGQKLIDGANRSPNFNYGKAGLLTKVIYPTGGHKEFEYEEHRYQWIGSNRVSEPVLSQKSLRMAVPNNETNDWQASESFSLPEGQYVTFEYRLRTAGNPDAAASVEFTGPTGVIFSRYLSNINKAENGSKTIYLSAGNYTLSVETGRVFLEDFAQAIVKWYGQTGTVNEKVAGGPRIKNVKTFSGIQKDDPQVKAFTYEMKDGTSSGVLVSKPEYMKTYSISHEGCVCAVINLSSSSVTPLGTTMKSHIGYRRIEVTDGSGGKTIFSYRSPFESEYEWRRGQSIKKTVQNQEKLIYKRVNQYYFSTLDDINYSGIMALKVNSHFKTRPAVPGSDAIIVEDTLFYKRPYRVISGWTYLDSRSKKVYSLEGSDYLETTSDYIYDPTHLQLIRKTQINSNGQVRMTEYDYAHENHRPGMGVSGAHMLSQPYSITVFDGKNNMLSKEWILWKDFWHDGESYWRPESRWQWNGDNL